MHKTKTTLYAILAIVLLWVVGSTTEIWYHHSHYDHAYSKANAWIVFGCMDPVTETTVTDCTMVADGYAVTVCDRKGNLWSYYDSDYQAKGTTLYVEFNRDRIVAVR